LAKSVIVDAGFLVALILAGDAHRGWATSAAAEHRRPWHTCEAVLTEAFFLLSRQHWPRLAGLMRRESLRVSFDLGTHQSAVLTLMERYANVPMSLADACLVRMTEILPDPILLTTDTDFRIYRRHGRQVVPCVLPP
jgi:predicted nucleic acid-binding protein